MNFQLNTINGHALLYVMAVNAEYGPHLKKRFTPLFTGVGPVEAAITLATTLSALTTTGQSPHLIISLGSAGSRTLAQTQVYQATSVSYRDMDASLLGHEKGLTPYLDQPEKLDLPHRLSNIPHATLSTGAKVISGTDYDAIEADMVDMETYALKRVCQHFSLPLIALRGISDGDEELEGHHSWTQYLHIIDEKLAAIVDDIENDIINQKLKF